MTNREEFIAEWTRIAHAIWECAGAPADRELSRKARDQLRNDSTREVKRIVGAMEVAGENIRTWRSPSGKNRDPHLLQSQPRGELVTYRGALHKACRLAHAVATGEERRRD